MTQVLGGQDMMGKLIPLNYSQQEEWNYRNDPKFSDRYAKADSADPDQTAPSLIRVYAVCHSVCIVWTHYSMVEPHDSNVRVITTNLLGVRIFRKFTVFIVTGCSRYLDKVNRVHVPCHSDEVINLLREGNSNQVVHYFIEEDWSGICWSVLKGIPWELAPCCFLCTLMISQQTVILK